MSRKSVSRVGRARIWSLEYQRRCFDAWYLNDRPEQPIRIREIIPANEEGKKPTTQAIRSWMTDWYFLADELDLRVEEKANKSLVDKRVKILVRHQENSVKVQGKAMDYLMNEGFDSSASAVQALFRGMEEERKTEGFSDLLERLENMTNNQVRDQIINLINRATENNQIESNPGLPDEIIDAEDTPLEDEEE